MLIERTTLPEGLLDAQAVELQALLGAPTLIHLPGERPEPLFVSVLMHGNEVTGLGAVQRVLKSYQVGGGRRKLPRALSLFVGNVSAAHEGVRRHDDQPDYNRIWPGTPEPDSPEQKMMRDIVELMRDRRVFASIDIHNTTGINPHYACLSVLDNQFFHLARLFGRTVVYFLQPKGVQSQAFSTLCPAVTLECGLPGQEHGVDHAATYINDCLHLQELPNHPLPKGDLDLFHTVAQVKIKPDVEFVIGEGISPLCLLPDIDHLNFHELPVGTSIGQVTDDASLPLVVISESGQDLSSEYFYVEDGQLRLRRPVMPSMLTLNAQIIRQDCLCYLMERYPIEALVG
ncbi:MAG TPA: peptidase M14 [Chromatiales bacterium]|jgi:hypothetical protein|nr:peptidase M14 [Chromatiaceae bacterium]HIN81706.1 peptidase M14 [Chromatiales bacterium]HIO55226.1 peptidase M14 [Chromatiales bacterium]